jgi:hypothetical protein
VLKPRIVSLLVAAEPTLNPPSNCWAHERENRWDCRVRVVGARVPGWYVHAPYTGKNVCMSGGNGRGGMTVK